MDPRKDRKIIDFAKRLRNKMHIDKLILFGSRVRNENLLDSDYDFIIVSSDFKGMFFTDRISKIYDFWRYKTPIEPLCYTPEEFETKRKEISIVQEAVKTGIEIK